MKDGGLGIDRSGSAFPGIVIANPGEYAYGAPGMSLRDYFAAQALQGVLASRVSLSYQFADMALDAYNIADTMLAERERA